MPRPVFMAALILTLVAIAVVGTTACGSGTPATTTTTAPSATTAPSVTAASPTTASSVTTASSITSSTAGAPTTAGAATTAGTATTAGLTTADTATQEQYKTEMSAWVLGPLQTLDTSVFDIPDPANATTEQIDAVAAFVSQAGALLDQLKTIKPSAEAAEPHNQFVKAYEDLLAATDKFVSAMRSRDASDLPAIAQAISTAQGQIQQSVSILSPMIGLTPPTT
jgi:hypothetical protein